MRDHPAAGKAQNVTVSVPKGKSLAVYSPLHRQKSALTVARNRIDTHGFRAKPCDLPPNT